MGLRRSSGRNRFQEELKEQWLPNHALGPTSHQRGTDGLRERMSEPFTRARPESSPGRWVLLWRATKGTCSGFPGLLELKGSSHVENVVILLIFDFGVNC